MMHSIAELLLTIPPAVWAYVVGALCLWIFLHGANHPDVTLKEWVGAEELRLDANDRILVLAPHPDDEVLGAGGIIQKAVARNIPVHVGLLTGGGGRPTYHWWTKLVRSMPFVGALLARGTVIQRRDESVSGGGVLGLPANAFSFLGYPDLGCLTMLGYHSGPTQEPMISRFSRYRKVMYSTARRPGVPYKAEEMILDVTEIMRQFRPTKVLLTHAGDDHPDHQALYILGRLAAWALPPEEQPAFYAYLVHSPSWPEEHGLSLDKSQEIRRRWCEGEKWVYSPVSARERQMKRQALEHHTSQYSQDAEFLSRFIQPVELFNDLPTLVPAGSGEVTVTDGMIVLTGQAPATGWLSPQGSISFLPYKKDKDFSVMPKIHIHHGPLGISVWNQSERLSLAAIHISQTASSWEVRVPLELLENPERLWVHVEGEMSSVFPAFAAWRIIEFAECRPARVSDNDTAGRLPTTAS
jgi:LmbE family N-acetylglucosaminyl deacetylase